MITKRNLPQLYAVGANCGTVARGERMCSIQLEFEPVRGFFIVAELVMQRSGHLVPSRWPGGSASPIVVLTLVRGIEPRYGVSLPG